MVKCVWWKIQIGRTYKPLDFGVSGSEGRRVTGVVGYGSGRRVLFVQGDRERSMTASRFRESVHAPCRRCGCTDLDCRQCVEKTGEPCHWVEADLCSACA